MWQPGCLQSKFGIHTFRVEFLSHDRPAPVDELQVQGVYNPRLLRKVIDLLTLICKFRDYLTFVLEVTLSLEIWYSLYSLSIVKICEWYRLQIIIYLSNLFKVIIREASKTAHDRMAHMTYTEGPAAIRSTSRNLKVRQIWCM